MDIIGQNGVFSVPEGAFVAEIDGAKATSLRSLYPRIAKALHFPAHFGKNLDALFDCLTSLDAIDKENVVLIIRRYDLFLSKEKEARREAALQTLRDAEKSENRYDDKHFRVIGA